MLSNETTWLSEFGIQFGPEYRVMVSAKGESVTLNGQELPVGFKQQIMPNTTLSRPRK
jgi:hypothetical protein